MAKAKKSNKGKSTSDKFITKKDQSLKKANTRVEVTIKKKILGQAPEEHHFVLTDGKRLKDIYELVDALDEMNDDIFKTHVNDLKNDFASWIEHVFDDKSLAEEIRSTDDKIETQMKLLKRLVDELKEK